MLALKNEPVWGQTLNRSACAGFASDLCESRLRSVAARFEGNSIHAAMLAAIDRRQMAVGSLSLDERKHVGSLQVRATGRCCR